MAKFNPNIIPYISPTRLFSRLVSDASLAIRWITGRDANWFETYNRLVSDVALRQLIIAKSVDRLGQCLSNRLIFPFIMQPILESSIIVPANVINDMHVTVPDNSSNLRLAYIIRLSGNNPAKWCGPTGSSIGEYSGVLRFVFTLNLDEYSEDFQVFYADYVIDSAYKQQRVKINKSYDTIYGSLSNPSSIESTFADRICGQITFNTLDVTDPEVRSFYDAVFPITGSVGIYPIANAMPIDFGYAATTFNSGILTDSAYNLFKQIFVEEPISELEFLRLSDYVGTFSVLNFGSGAYSVEPDTNGQVNIITGCNMKVAINDVDISGYFAAIEFVGDVDVSLVDETATVIINT